MGYMVRLGLWGEGSPAFRDFSKFLEAVQVGGGGSQAVAGQSGGRVTLEAVL